MDAVRFRPKIQETRRKGFAQEVAKEAAGEVVQGAVIEIPITGE